MAYNKYNWMGFHKFCLGKDQLEDNFTSTFKHLYEKRGLGDVKICVDNGHVMAHKIVLCAGSAFFKTLLTNRSEELETVILKDVTLEIMELLIQFLYQGETMANKEQLIPLVQLGKTLCVKGLEEPSDGYLEYNVTQKQVGIRLGNFIDSVSQAQTSINLLYSNADDFNAFTSNETIVGDSATGIAATNGTQNDVGAISGLKENRGSNPFCKRKEKKSTPEKSALGCVNMSDSSGKLTEDSSSFSSLTDTFKKANENLSVLKIGEESELPAISSPEVDANGKQEFAIKKRTVQKRNEAQQQRRDAKETELQENKVKIIYTNTMQMETKPEEQQEMSQNVQQQPNARSKADKKSQTKARNLKQK